MAFTSNTQFVLNSLLVIAIRCQNLLYKFVFKLLNLQKKAIISYIAFEIMKFSKNNPLLPNSMTS